jgi:predicted nucleotidyltransferase
MVDSFKTDLENLDSRQLFRKYILSGAAHALTPDALYLLREEVADHFGVEFNDVILVGSGKLGFSIKRSRRYLPFGEDSDIDLAVVSPKLFQEVWEEVYLHRASGQYWESYEQCAMYISKGWIRPDKLPSAFHFEFADKWWKFFQRLASDRKYGPYKIRGALYHSWFFFQEYQKISIQECIEQRNNEIRNNYANISNQ